MCFSFCHHSKNVFLETTIVTETTTKILGIKKNLYILCVFELNVFMLSRKCSYMETSPTGFIWF